MGFSIQIGTKYYSSDDELPNPLPFWNFMTFMKDGWKFYFYFVSGTDLFLLKPVPITSKIWIISKSLPGGTYKREITFEDFNLGIAYLFEKLGLEKSYLT